jgi:hypothetical protein
MERKGPKWVQNALAPSSSIFGLKEVSINALIPKAPVRQKSKNFTIENTLSILRSVRAREGAAGLIRQTKEMATYGQCTGSKRRESTCKKWLKKMKIEA